MAGVTGPRDRLAWVRDTLIAALIDEEDADELAPGTIVAGRYRIGERLGAGAIGQVYWGEHTTVRRPVAVKVLSRRWLGNHQMVARFRSEAQSASAAGHPNIVDVLDAGELDNGLPFIVMEHLPGRELFEILHEAQGMSIERTATIGRDVARALAAAHHRDIVHRDLKAENVMIVERDGVELVKVLDFGVAHVATEGSRRTTPGMVIGTPEYMAPEQVKGARPTPAIDVYALGVLLHEMLVGSPPFEASEPIEVLALKTAGPAPSVAKRRPDLPASLVAIVDQCLDADPKRRPSASEVAQRLHALVERGAPFVTAPRPIIVPRRSPWLAVGAVAVLGAGLWLAMRDAGTEVAAATPPRHEPPAPVLQKGAPISAHEPAPPIEPEPEPEPEDEDEDEHGSTGASEVAVAEAPVQRSTMRRDRSGRDRAARDRPPRDLPPSDLPKVESDPPSAKPDDASADSRACKEVRQQARDARQVQDWPGVLRHTSKAGCWESGLERRRLRVKAMLESGRYADCISTGGNSEDKDIAKWVDLCRRKSAAAAG